jgi:lambda family phage portal protein
MALSAYNDAGYITPRSSRKSVKGWNAALGSPAKDIDKKLEGVKAASRDLSMNSPVAAAIFRRYKTNVVGSGLQVQPQVDRDFLGLSDDQAEELNDQLERNFDLWATSFDADYQGERTFAELQELLFTSFLINGDSFFALPTSDPRRTGWPFRTTMRLIDGDLVRNPTQQYLDALGNTNAKIRNGVEYDTQNRLAAYWVSSSYLDEYDRTGGEESFERIPIFNELGERQIFSLMDHERIGQRRGIPFIAPAVSRTKAIDRYVDNELIASTIQAMLTVFVRDVDNTGASLGEGYNPSQVLGGGGAEDPDSASEDKFEGEEFNIEMGSANIVTLPGKTDISVAESRQNRDEFAPYFNAMVTEVSAACSLPRDQVMLDFQKSYSALRGAALEAAKEWKVRKAKLISRCNRIVYEAVSAESIASGRIKAPKFFDDLLYHQAYCRSRWVGLGTGYLDPYKEALASEVKIKSALSTHEEEYQEVRGGRWRPMVERLAKEQKLIRDKGLAEVEPDGRHEPNGGQL